MMSHCLIHDCLCYSIFLLRNILLFIGLIDICRLNYIHWWICVSGLRCANHKCEKIKKQFYCEKMKPEPYIPTKWIPYVCIYTYIYIYTRKEEIIVNCIDAYMRRTAISIIYIQLIGYLTLSHSNFMRIRIHISRNQQIYYL